MTKLNEFRVTGPHIGRFLLQGGTVLALIALIVFFFAMRPDIFLTFVNVKNIMYQVSILAVIAAAQTIVTLTCL
jgi:ribose transport system permease protein